MNLPIIQHRRAWYVVSALIVATGIAGLIMFGLRVGIDFRGGTFMSIVWEGERPTNDAVTRVFADVGISGVVVQAVGEKETIVRSPVIDELKHREIATHLEKEGKYREDRFETIGPSISAELQRKSLWSIVLVLIAILLYVAWSFRGASHMVSSWRYSIITIVILFHDVFIPIGLFAFLGKYIGAEINADFVVALLTILGYSVNDVIVVFDRIRENITRMKGATFQNIVRASINETFARNVNTSLTVFFALLAIYLFGGATTQLFALALMSGVIASLYSSTFIASPLLVSWHEKKV